MGIAAADETDRPTGDVTRAEPKPVGEADAPRRRTTKQLGHITVGKEPVKVWVKEGTLHFRLKHRRKVQTLSLGAAYDVACGQLQFFYGKDH